MIECKDVVFRYSDAKHDALSGIDLTVFDGEILAIVGHNGSGKSTLAKHFNALLLPESGSVSVFGMDTKDEAQTLKIRQRVGMVFQNPDNQLVTTMVEEDVAFGPENLGVPPEEIRRRVDMALESVGMTKYAKGAPHLLSGGQKQRIAIAGMLAIEPEVLVLDEATAMLDPKGRGDVMRIVTRLNKEKHITIVMITQYMEEAVGADRVAVMSDGRILDVGTPQEVFKKRDMLREHRLDVPAMAELGYRLRALGLDIDYSALTVESMTEELCLSLLKN